MRTKRSSGWAVDVPVHRHVYQPGDLIRSRYDASIVHHLRSEDGAATGEFSAREVCLVVSVDRTTYTVFVLCSDGQLGWLTSARFLPCL